MIKKNIDSVEKAVLPQEVSDFKNNTDIKDETASSVSSWLDSLNLSQYSNAFAEKGYTNFRHVSFSLDYQ
jgi:hypothetical protein